MAQGSSGQRPAASAFGGIFRWFEDGLFWRDAIEAGDVFVGLPYGNAANGWVFDALTADRDNEYLMLDSTIVRAHQQAATGKGGAGTRLWGVPEAD